MRLRLRSGEVRLQTCFSSSPDTKKKKEKDHLARERQTLTFDLSFTRKQVFKQDKA